MSGKCTVPKCNMKYVSTIPLLLGGRYCPDHHEAAIIRSGELRAIKIKRSWTAAEHDDWIEIQLGLYLRNGN